MPKRRMGQQFISDSLATLPARQMPYIVWNYGCVQMGKELEIALAARSQALVGDNPQEIVLSDAATLQTGLQDQRVLPTFVS